MDLRRLMCCGVMEASGVASSVRNYGPKGALRSILNASLINTDSINRKFAFLLFTQAISPITMINRDDDTKYGDRLKDFILENKLGTVTQTEEVINPNSGNYITMYMWTVDWKAVGKWEAENMPKQPLKKSGPTMEPGGTIVWDTNQGRPVIGNAPHARQPLEQRPQEWYDMRERARGLQQSDLSAQEQLSTLPRDPGTR